MNGRELLIWIGALAIFWAPIFAYWWWQDWRETKGIREADKHWEERNPRH